MWRLAHSFLQPRNTNFVLFLLNSTRWLRYRSFVQISPMWELQNCLQMESGHYWWQLVNFVNISVRKTNCYNNDTNCAGSPPEGDGPSQRQILAVGREVQGDNGRAGESPVVIAFDLKGVETERDTLRKKVKETEIKIEVEFALLSKSWSIALKVLNKKQNEEQTKDQHVRELESALEEVRSMIYLLIWHFHFLRQYFSAIFCSFFAPIFCKLILSYFCLAKADWPFVANFILLSGNSHFVKIMSSLSTN